MELYDRLLTLVPTPFVALNRAVAVAEVEGPEPALELVEGVALDAWHRRDAIRADLLRRLDRRIEAAQTYTATIARAVNEAERRFLRRRLQAMSNG